MAKTIHLVRHGHHALLGRTLCGRMKGVELDDLGCVEIARCAEAITPRPNLVQSSPQRRCMQSACILAAHYGLAVEIVPALDELDYGDWTGQSFDELDRDLRWSVWNTQRGLPVVTSSARRYCPLPANTRECTPPDPCQKASPRSAMGNALCFQSSSPVSGTSA